MESYAYRQLTVWQKAMDFVNLVYTQIKLFPAEERFALCDQLRRAVVSIPSNIAEGKGRASNKDYAHFLAIARNAPKKLVSKGRFGRRPNGEAARKRPRSLFETMTQLEIAVNLGYIPSIPQEVESLATEIRRMLGAMLQKYGAYVVRSSSPSTSTSNPNLILLNLNLQPQPKKLMLLGGIRYLLPVIESAHKLGIYVITADYLPDNIAHRYSDEYVNVSILDRDAVLAIAREKHIDGILSIERLAA